MFLRSYWRFLRSFVAPAKKLNCLLSCITLIMIVVIGSCFTTKRLASSPIHQTSPATISTNQLESDEWRKMTEEEEEQIWNYILNSPLGIAALNQLAIEGFISPNCPKTFYISQEYGGFQTLLQIKCKEARGVSIATAYDEVRVTFNRFEDNIENFEIKRIYQSE